jgi:hypothetical protein
VYGEFADDTKSFILQDDIEYTECDPRVGCTTIVIPTTTDPAEIKTDLISGGYVDIEDKAQGSISLDVSQNS